MACYLAEVRPYISTVINRLELLNEVVVLIMSTSLLLFTDDYIWNLERSYEIGWFVIAIVISNILFNVTICLIDAIKSCIKKTKAWCLRRKRLRAHQYRMDIIKKA